MRLITITTVLALAAPVFSTETYALQYDRMYDQSKAPLSDVACSTGEYGLLTKGYHTFGDLPNFPFIGGAPQILSWNSPNCGTCWQLTYTDASGVSTSLSFTAINTAQKGFDISFEGMDRLTGGNAETLDGAPVTASQLPATECNLIPARV